MCCCLGSSRGKPLGVVVALRDTLQRNGLENDHGIHMIYRDDLGFAQLGERTTDGFGC